LQYVYTAYSDKEGDKPFTKMLAELVFKPAMDVKVIVGNKGIVVDGARVLVSSANWSGDGVIRNREAGLVITIGITAPRRQSRMMLQLALLRTTSW
jgi:phosphatidylserine/phosphatidylglycerophosphate/cardiolipin synthase-like enzyme